MSGAGKSGETDTPSPLLTPRDSVVWNGCSVTVLARLFEQFPLTCRYCGADMKIIAFVIETPSVRAILEHIGEPTCPPAISPARPCAAQPCSAWVPAQIIHGLVVRCSIIAHPPAWEDTPVEVDQDYDPLAQPEPEVEFDQRVQW